MLDKPISAIYTVFVLYPHSNRIQYSFHMLQYSIAGFLLNKY